MFNSRLLISNIANKCQDKFGHFSGESNRPLTTILLKSVAIHLPFLSRYFCKSTPSSWQRVVYTPPICITIRLPFVSRYFRRSIRVRGRWNTPQKSVNNYEQVSRQVAIFLCTGRKKPGTEKQPKQKVFGWDIPRTSGRISRWTSRPKNFRPIARSAEKKVYLPGRP